VLARTQPKGTCRPERHPGEAVVISVALIEDNRLVREGIAALLNPVGTPVFI
jgi:hypothetical protein